MIKYRLNKNRIEEEMEKRLLNYGDLAHLLGWSRSLLYYAVNQGGKSFAPKIAEVLKIERGDIIFSIPKRGGNPEKEANGL